MLAILILATALVSAQPVEASVYYVHECGNGIDVPGSEVGTASDDGRFGLSNQCGNSNIGLAAYPLADGGTSLAGRSGRRIWTAPAGTSIQGVTGRHILRHNNGFAASLRIGSRTGSIDVVRNSGGDASMVAFSSFVWSPFSLQMDPFRTFEQVVTCEAVSCPHAGVDTAAYIKELTFNVDDYTSPSAALGGSLFSGGWKRGADTVEYSGSDTGSGIRYLDTYVNGSLWRHDQAGCGTAMLDGRLVATRMAPCPPSFFATHSADTSSGPFQEGENRIEQCVEDFGTNRVCASVRTLNVDNLPPSAPVDLTLTEEPSWRSDNSFVLRWANPDSGEGSSIAGAHYRVADGPARYVPGADLAALGQLELPGEGRHEVKVWLEDEAGNASEQSAASIAVGVDRTPPQTSISGLRAGWATDEVSIALSSTDPLSGIRSLRWAVDGGSQQESTGAASINLRDEGEHRIRYHATDHAGNSESEVERVVRIDRTPPETSIGALPDGWSRTPVPIAVNASDALSGMSGNPGDVTAAAYTAIRLDDSEWQRFPGGLARLELGADGVHTVHYFARDLAGKESIVSARQVRIDRTPPNLGFAAEQDPARPAEIRAPVSDAVSGVAGGGVAYRELGSEQPWTPLSTRLDGASGHPELVSEFPADDLPRTRYEFLASAVDNAGNWARTGLRSTGQRMVLSNPVKITTVLRAAVERPRAIRRGRSSRSLRRKKVLARAATLRYRQPAVVSGSLKTPGGRPLGGQPIEATVTPASGGPGPATLTGTTRPDGQFRFRIPAGPSREVRVRYGGTPLLSRSAAPRLRLRTRAAARLVISPRRVRNFGRIRMTGSIGRRLARIPRRGKLVALQFLDVRGRVHRWRPVALVRADQRGRFSYGYKFRHIQRPQRITFRAAVVPEANWPYAFGASRRAAIVALP